MYEYLTFIILFLDCIGIFYFLLGNIRPRFRSKLKIIQLVALCKREYMKRYTLDPVLKELVQDIEKLVCYIYYVCPLYI